MTDLNNGINALVLWAWPRTRSTVFERFFLARNTDDVEVQHEPLSAPICWSKSRVSRLFSAERCEKEFKQFENDTFESVWYSMTHPPEGKKAVFTKDMSKYIVEIDNPLPGAMKPPDMAKDGNPTYITSDLLLAKNVKHVFLIRTPEKSVPSWARLGRRSDVGVGHLDKHELGIRQSVRLYDFLAENLAEPPLIIESDDIFEHAEEIVRMLCESLNVDYQPSMLEWPDDPKVTELFAKWSGWHDDVAESHGVCNKRGKEHDWGMDEEVKAAIAEYMEDYHSLRAKAYKFGSN